MAGVFVPDGVSVLQDSGAFSDGMLSERLPFAAALERQRKHAERYGYADKVVARASYDLLIDEKWVDGVRKKLRWERSEAERAVQVTIDAAAFLAVNETQVARVFSAQGVAVDQYVECVRGLLPFFRSGDVLGLGGWCIMGIKPKQIYPVFEQIIPKVMSLAALSGLHRVHIWGVLYEPALKLLAEWGRWLGLTVSTDSRGPSTRPAFGSWGYADWVDHDYKRPDPFVRGLERARHVQAVRSWLAAL